MLGVLAARAVAGRAALFVQRAGLGTSAARASGEKTAIQKWGWDYLVKQEALKRPLSPHLTVYKPMLTWMVSGAFRVAGVTMGAVLLIGGTTVMLAPMDFTAMIEKVRAWNLPAPVTAALRFIICFPLIFHALNGIRFLGFDMAKGMSNIGQVYKTGWAVVGVAFVLAVLVTFWREPRPAKALKK